VAQADEETGKWSVIDPATGRTVFALPESEWLPANVAAVSRDGGRVVSWKAAGAAGQPPRWTLTVRDANTGRVVSTTTFDREPSYLCCTPDGARLLVQVQRADGVHELAVMDADTGRTLRTLPYAEWNRVLLLPGGRHAVLGFGADVTFLDIETGARRDLRGHRAAVQAVESLPDGSRVLTADTAGVLMVWNPATGQPVVSLKVADRPVRSLAVSPDGHRLAVQTEDDRVRVWDLRPGETETAIPSRWAGDSRATFSLDGRRVVALDADRNLRVWEAAGLKLVRQWQLPPPPADAGNWGLFVSPDGGVAYTYKVGKDGGLTPAAFWNAATGEHGTQGQPVPHFQTLFTPNASRELVLRDGTLRVIDRTPSAGELAIRAIATRPDRESHMNRAGEHYNARRWFAAAVQYDLADRVGRLTPEERYWRGYARLELGQADAARDDLRAWHDTERLRDLTTPHEFFDRVMLELYSGRPEEARRAATRMRRRHVHPREAVAGLPLTASPLAPLAAVVPAAVAVDTAEWHEHFAWAAAYTRPAPLAADEFLWLAGDNSHARGMVLLRAGRAAQALTQFNRVHEAFRDAGNHYRRALAFHQLGRRTSALEAFELGEDWRRRRTDPFKPGGPDALNAGQRAEIELLRDEVRSALRPPKEDPLPAR
jgi:hypothetical protein